MYKLPGLDDLCAELLRIQAMWYAVIFMKKTYFDVLFNFLRTHLFISRQFACLLTILLWDFKRRHGFRMRHFTHDHLNKTLCYFILFFYRAKTWEHFFFGNWSIFCCRKFLSSFTKYVFSIVNIKMSKICL